jgi:hypothetical protein
MRVKNKGNASYLNKEDVVHMDSNIKIALTEEQQAILVNQLKAGVYRQLASQSLISDETLSQLLSINREQDDLLLRNMVDRLKL